MMNEVSRQEVANGVVNEQSQNICRNMLNALEHDLYDAPNGGRYLMVYLTPGQRGLFDILEYGSQKSTSYEAFQQYLYMLPMGEYIALVTALRRYTQ